MKHFRLAIFGGSNGGTLVAACVNQNPELYGCVVANAGLINLFIVFNNSFSTKYLFIYVLCNILEPILLKLGLN